MSEQLHKPSILIVDDEKKICDLLGSLLKIKYSVDTAYCAQDAFALISQKNYDLLVTDLKLPDGFGIDILRSAKEKDFHIEVIIITGYASLDTATDAINLGASSYLFKPVSMPNFSVQVEKAIANRSFYLKSQMLVNNFPDSHTPHKEHIANLTHIHELFKKLMFSLNISEIMKVLLHDLNIEIGSSLCVAGLNIFGHSEIYAFPFTGNVNDEDVKRVIYNHWYPLFEIVGKNKFIIKKTSITIFRLKSANTINFENLKPIVVPLVCMGEIKGSISVFIRANAELNEERLQYFHVFSTLVAPLIENAYIHRRTKSLAATDPLTGVANHRTFHEMLSREIARANRDLTEFGLILLDIDDFKKINDVHGHLIGDAILLDLCQKILGVIREEDLLARYGGEEFVVIVTSSRVRGTFALAERIRKEIATSPVILKNLEISYTVSVGLSIYSGRSPRKKESLVRDADDALYTSKNQGKNQVSLR